MNDADRIIEFVKARKGGFINYHHWVSGSSTVVYPITTWVDDDSSTIEFQLSDCDGRNWRGFESVLKRNFQCVESAYYCRYDGSCPDVYRIIISS